MYAIASEALCPIGQEIATPNSLGDRKIKRPLPPTASAHPMPPCLLRPAPGVGPHAPRQRLASAGCRRQAAGSHRSARTGRVAGDWRLHGWSCSGGGCSGGSSLGNVSRTLSWGIQAFSVGDDLRVTLRDTAVYGLFYDCKCGIVHYRERNCNAKLLPPCSLLPAPGVGPHAPRQRLASAGCRRQAAGLHRSARTGRVAGDGLLGGGHII